ncbi:MAG: TetR family transcriptional regulator [Firmicutes bacterium]|nr:TetR family transcriptional regulator [Bacillota bacterium]
MPKGSPELTNARKEEIISACETLYKEMSFKEITIKEIANFTSFTRTSIYNYFETKEEIFLALLTREYRLWGEEIERIISENDMLSVSEFSDKIAHSLENRKQLLKILSMNHYDMEENSREENLVEMKRYYGAAIKTFDKCLIKFFPEMSENERTDVIYVFFPFMFGIYPYSVVTEKQRNAMKKADIDYKYSSIYGITYRCIKNLLEK